MKIIKATRGKDFAKGYYNSDMVHFTTCYDGWEYHWVKRNFGIVLRPGETKKFKIVEIRMRAPKRALQASVSTQIAKETKCPN